LWGISLDEALRWKTEDKKAAIIGGQFPYTTVNVPLSWREFLQRFGTEMGRKTFGESFWLEQFEKKYDLPAGQHGIINYVVRDVRFDNEAHFLKCYGGDTWIINRPDLTDKDTHESEAGISEDYIMGDIDNDSTLEELYPVLDEWMTEGYGLQQVSKSSMGN
jgi:hypothetical protein